MKTLAITRRQSQKRFFHKSSCDCRECLEHERRVSLWIMLGSVIVAALIGSYLVVSVFAW